MSINPVQGTGPSAADASVAAPAVRRHVATTSDFQPLPTRVNPGTESTREVRHPLKRTETPETPRDAVQVQRDDESNGQIVIKYLDHSGQVILQIPSSQVLSLARAIEKALEEQASHRANAIQNTALSKGVTSNG